MTHREDCLCRNQPYKFSHRALSLHRSRPSSPLTPRTYRMGGGRWGTSPKGRGRGGKGEEDIPEAAWEVLPGEACRHQWPRGALPGMPSSQRAAMLPGRTHIRTVFLKPGGEPGPPCRSGRPWGPELQGWEKQTEAARRAGLPTPTSPPSCSSRRSHPPSQSIPLLLKPAGVLALVTKYITQNLLTQKFCIFNRFPGDSQRNGAWRRKH